MFTELYSRWFGIERRPWRAGGKVGSREKARARIAITCSRSPFAQIVRRTDGRRSPSRSAPSAFNWRLSCCSAARTADLEQLRVREQNLGDSSSWSLTVPPRFCSRTRSWPRSAVRAALQQLKRQLKAEGALLDGDLRPSVRRTIWANGDREQVIAIRARASLREPTLPPARQGLRSMPNHREYLRSKHLVTSSDVELGVGTTTPRSSIDQLWRTKQ